MAARSFLGAGYIYVGRFVNGVAQPLGPRTYANKVSITPNSDTKQSTSKGYEDYGQVQETVTIPQATEFALDLSEVVGNNLALQFMGTTAALAQASGTLAATSFTAHLGQQIELGHKNFLTVVVKDTTATTTYVKDVDYTVNMNTGMVMPLEGGAIDEGDDLKISGTYGAAEGVVIKGQKVSEIRARIFFDGKNLADGSKVHLDIFEAVMTASSEFDFLADDFGNLSLTGQLKTPAGKDAPYEVTTYA